MESKRSGPIYLTPRQLGGQISESEARQKQQRIQVQSKYQKMNQREEYRRKQKEEEDAKIQQMKDVQRKKAEKLEEKRQQQDLERKQRWNEDRCRQNNEFLDRFKPINHSYDRRFRQQSEWDDHQEDDMDFIRNKESLKPSQDMAINKEQDEDWMLQKALKDSLLTLKIEEETRLEEIKKTHHMQPKQQTYRQQQKEEEERRLKAMKDEQRRKADVLKQREEDKTLSQEEEHRRVNSAFLDKLQRQNASQYGYSGETNTWD